MNVHDTSLLPLSSAISSTRIVKISQNFAFCQIMSNHLFYVLSSAVCSNYFDVRRVSYQGAQFQSGISVRCVISFMRVADLSFQSETQSFLISNVKWSFINSYKGPDDFTVQSTSSWMSCLPLVFIKDDMKMCRFQGVKPLNFENVQQQLQKLDICAHRGPLYGAVFRSRDNQTSTTVSFLTFSRHALAYVNTTFRFFHLGVLSFVLTVATVNWAQTFWIPLCDSQL